MLLKLNRLGSHSCLVSKFSAWTQSPALQTPKQNLQPTFKSSIYNKIWVTSYDGLLLLRNKKYMHIPLVSFCILLKMCH